MEETQRTGWITLSSIYLPGTRPSGRDIVAAEETYIITRLHYKLIFFTLWGQKVGGQLLLHWWKSSVVFLDDVEKAQSDRVRNCRLVLLWKLGQFCVEAGLHLSFIASFYFITRKPPLLTTGPLNNFLPPESTWFYGDLRSQWWCRSGVFNQRVELMCWCIEADSCCSYSSRWLEASSSLLWLHWLNDRYCAARCHRAAVRQVTLLTDRKCFLFTHEEEFKAAQNSFTFKFSSFHPFIKISAVPLRSQIFSERPYQSSVCTSLTLRLSGKQLLD